MRSRQIAQPEDARNKRNPIEYSKTFCRTYSLLTLRWYETCDHAALHPAIATREDVRTDFGNPPNAHIAEGPLHFTRKYLDRPRCARLPAACRAVKGRPTDQHHLCTEGQCLEYVAAATDAAVEYDSAAVADRLIMLKAPQKL